MRSRTWRQSVAIARRRAGIRRHPQACPVEAGLDLRPVGGESLTLGPGERLQIGELVSQLSFGLDSGMPIPNTRSAPLDGHVPHRASDEIVKP